MTLNRRATTAAYCTRKEQYKILSYESIAPLTSVGYPDFVPSLCNTQLNYNRTKNTVDISNTNRWTYLNYLARYLHRHTLQNLVQRAGNVLVRVGALYKIYHTRHGVEKQREQSISKSKSLHHCNLRHICYGTASS